jgi:type I restriction enzyme S subunit
MSGKPALDISEAQWQIVRDILRRIVPARQVWAFGSRVTHKANAFYDLDLVIIGEKPLPIEESAALADEFSQSDLPWKVDVVDWATTSAPFRQVIERDKVVVQDGHEGAQASLVAPFTPAPEPSGAAPGGRGRRLGRNG